MAIHPLFWSKGPSDATRKAASLGGHTPERHSGCGGNTTLFYGKMELGLKTTRQPCCKDTPPTETHLRLLNRKSLSNGLLSIEWTNDFYDHRQSMLLILFFENKLQVEPVKWLVAEKATVNILCSKLCTFCNVCVVKLHSPSPHLKFQKLNRQTSCQSLSSKKQLPKHIALHGGDYIIISQNLFFIAGQENFKSF